MNEGESVQEHLSNFQKILMNLFSIGEKVKKKIKALVLLSSLFSLFESLTIALLIEKSTIKMDKITFILFQNEILRREN